jgi:3-hydroxyisobutyrate dehydrogenase-like beta-hydroxyacid dehydrogenase
MTPITLDHRKLAFIGIGSMGRPIARRLLESGYNLTAYNRDRSKAEALIGYGGIVANSIAEFASNIDVVLSCLANDDAVRSVYTGSNGVFANVRPGTVLIEMSTVNPETSRELYKLGAARGVSVLDVPISGSTPAAEQGTLTLFGGGDEKIFHNTERIFRAVAQQYFYLGPSGSGTTMKLVVNTLLGVGMQAIAEAVALG